MKRSVLAAQAAHESDEIPVVEHNYDAVRDVVIEAWSEPRGRCRPNDFPIAQAAGYSGSARDFRRLVAEVKAGWQAKNHRESDPASGRRATCWSLTGARSARCSSSAP